LAQLDTARQRYIRSKNIYCLECSFIILVTVDF